MEAFKRCLPGWDLRCEPFNEKSYNVKSGSPTWLDELGQLTLFRRRDRRGDHYQLRFMDQISVTICFEDRSVNERPLGPSTPQSTRDHFLADQVLPRILGHQGRLVLHAGAIRLDGKAFLLLGKSGSGKSTLAAGFDRAGYRLVGDDALIVSWQGDCPHAAAVYPSLRLFPDSIAALFPAAVATAIVAPYTPKLRVEMPFDDAGDPADLPISAVFVIGEPAPNSKIHIRRLSIAKACMAIIENSFALDPTDPDRSQERLQRASRLAREIPAFSLSYPHEFARLEDVREAILSTVADEHTRAR